MKYCPKCGNEILEDSLFCNKCGYSLKEGATNLGNTDKGGPTLSNGAKEYSSSSFYRVDETTEQQNTFDEVYKAKKAGGSLEEDIDMINTAPIPWVNPAIEPPVFTPPAPPAPLPKKTVAPQQVEQIHSQPVRQPMTSSQPQMPLAPLAPSIEAIPASVPVASPRNGGVKSGSSYKLLMILLAVIAVVLIISTVIIMVFSKGDEPVQIARHTDGTSETDKTPTKEPVKKDEEVTSVVPPVVEEPVAELPVVDINVDKLVIDTVFTYYASYIDTLNNGTTDYLLQSSDNNLTIVKEKMEGANKGFTFISKSINFDLDSVTFYDDIYCKLTAEFDYDYRKTDSTDDWQNSTNKQRYTLVYDEDQELWLVDSNEIDSTIVFSTNTLMMGYD